MAFVAEMGRPSMGFEPADALRSESGEFSAIGERQQGQQGHTQGVVCGTSTDLRTTMVRKVDPRTDTHGTIND